MSLSIAIHAQEAVEKSPLNFNVSIANVFGDLNKDGIADSVLVRQDTLHENAPYLLEVFLTQREGHKKLLVSTTTAIDPQYPEGRANHHWTHGFSQLNIRNGVLWLETELIRGNIQHRFRYQNERLELIGYSSIDVTAGQITEIDYNLSTGRRVVKTGDITDNEYAIVSDTTILLNPLPTLSEFRPFSNKWY